MGLRQKLPNACRIMVTRLALRLQHISQHSLEEVNLTAVPDENAAQNRGVSRKLLGQFPNSTLRPAA
jgi:hypothetical protein